MASHVLTCASAGEQWVASCGPAPGPCRPPPSSPQPAVPSPALDFSSRAQQFLETGGLESTPWTAPTAVVPWSPTLASRGGLRLPPGRRLSGQTPKDSREELGAPAGSGPGLGPLLSVRNPSLLQAIRPDSPVAFTHWPAGLTPSGRPPGRLASSEPLLGPFPLPCGHHGAETRAKISLVCSRLPSPLHLY